LVIVIYKILKMNLKITLKAVICLSLFFLLTNCKKNQSSQNNIEDSFLAKELYPTSKPYTRWWWNARKLDSLDIKDQLDWLKSEGFGGVEIAFIYPVNRDPSTKRTPWLSKEMNGYLRFSKEYADEIGLGCDFTFGTLWPFGDKDTPMKFRTKKFGDQKYYQTETRGWILPDTLYILDHLNKKAFEYYAEKLEPMFEGTTGGDLQTAFFCDSWEVETKYIWSKNFEEDFKSHYGYDIVPYMDEIYDSKNKHKLHDYMKMVAKKAKEEFYEPFHKKAKELGGISRVQVAGAPVDLIETYAIVDVPETEAMLYEPNFSKIVASAAALSEKEVVSSETFTCIYGWPDMHIKEEKIEHLKLVADALFANGVNQIIWHGYNYNPINVDTISFYATSHVGKKGSLTKHLKPFNKYMTNVSKIMRKGNSYSDVAVYLPIEDSWMAGFYPDSLQMPWSWGQYEQRYLKHPEEMKGYNPLWINAGFLDNSKIVDNKLIVNHNEFKALYIDSEFISLENLKIIKNLADKGLPIIIKNKPIQADFIKNTNYENIYNEMISFDNVTRNLKSINIEAPIISGEELPEYWIRKDKDEYFIFFANPKTKSISYPLDHNMSTTLDKKNYPITLNLDSKTIDKNLKFQDSESILLKIDNTGNIENIDINFFR